MPKKKKEFKKILLVRNDRFGEFLLNIPAMSALKNVYPQARLILAVNPAVYELASAVECIDEVVVWNEQFRKGLRKQKFDACVVLNPTKEAHWACFWAGIPVRVGYDRKWGFLLTHKLKDTKYQGARHEVEYNFELVSLIGAGNSGIASSQKTLLAMTNIPVDNFDFLAGAVAIHPFTSDPVKQWPLERFKELARRIARELGVKVVMVGKNDGIASAPMAPRNDEGKASPRNDGIIDMVNKTYLVELAALLKHCSLLISCDSGPMHLAASVGTPVVALFRNDLPGKTAKRWGPRGEGHMVIESGNLADISVEDVFNRVSLKLLDKTNI